jgi:DNA-binding transcriptional regulator YdaS (Cro superfamily)
MLVAWLGIAAPALAQWASLGAMPPPKRDQASLVFRNAQGGVAVTAVAPGIVRVRFARGPAFGRDHSYAVIATPTPDASAKVETGRDRSTIATGGVRAVLQHSPFRVAFEDDKVIRSTGTIPRKGSVSQERRSAYGSGCETTSRFTGWARRTEG